MVFLNLKTTHGAIPKRAHRISWRIESSLEMNALSFDQTFLYRNPRNVFLKCIYLPLSGEWASAVVSWEKVKMDPRLETWFWGKSGIFGLRATTLRGRRRRRWQPRSFIFPSHGQFQRQKISFRFFVPQGGGFVRFSCSRSRSISKTLTKPTQTKFQKPNISKLSLF